MSNQPQQATPAEPQSSQRRIEPIFDASGTLRHVSGAPGSTSEPTSRNSDRQTGFQPR
ncbi:MAG: hypothetical protein Q7T44_10220 [Parvibaculum sp.]|nr:hypothetical protein [Parvibaculum sp.]